ncbi:MAG: phenylalanine--tRNA ligase subunit beta [Victivallaceae bacterium]|nr:phenylalanine--tRNA ligase subunit beta [Victivallaceae bacterium]
MIISRNWLKKYVALNCPVEELCEKLTAAGIEVEAVEKLGSVPAGVISAKILERTKHPDSDHLSVCKVTDGSNTLQIVCGAPNCDAGNIVPLATIGTKFHTEEGDFTIKKGKIRGVESFGMMCSEKELGISENHEGLMLLPENTALGRPLGELLEEDYRLELEVTPNRPDWLSHWGIARDVSCLLNEEAHLPVVELEEKTATVEGLVTVSAPDLCIRYIGRVIDNVKVCDSPKWMKDALQAVGIRPINNIVDITNFVQMELGQPMHCFDLAKLAGGHVIVRRAMPGESIVTLDAGRKVELNSDNLVIADDEKPVALAGVIGGEFSGVDRNTTSILLESAVFQSSNIRATSRKSGISTDSSYRYERGVDYDMAEFASRRAAQLILELAGGQQRCAPVDVNSGRPEEKTIVCRFERIRALLGTGVANGRIVEIFRKLHLKVADVTDESCVVTCPLFRLDLEREADLAEEVVRIDGLDTVPLIAVAAKSVAPICEDAIYTEQKLRDQLVALGLFECMHYSMVGAKSALSDTRFTEKDLVRLDNPLSGELAYLRPSLFGEMLATVERNISRRNLDFSFFELGRVFCGNAGKHPEERMELCLMMSGRRAPEQYGHALAQSYDFYDLKGAIESLFRKRRYANWSIEPATDGRFIPGCTAVVKLDGKEIGFLGELPTELTQTWRTPYKVFGAVLDADALLAGKTRSDLYKGFSLFPASTRDVAFVAESSLTNAAVLEFIRRLKLPNLESAALFDIFSDEKVLGAGRKSMAYKLTFRRSDGTLTDAEANKVYETLRKALAEKLHVELR